MATINTGYLRNYVANTFMNSVAGPKSTDSLYVFIGRQNPWNISETAPNPIDGTISFNVVWDNMIATKKATLNNISMVIRRISWTSNTIYHAYDDHNNSIFYDGVSRPYIITSNNEIYKCLSNNSGIPSTVEPIGFGTTSNNYIQTTSDGYIWKYMLNIQPGDIFINNFWIPVPITPPFGSAQKIISDAAIPGSIDIIKVVNSGNNYTNGASRYILDISGDGLGANAYANVSGGQIKNIVITNKGTGYTYANITVDDGVGSSGNVKAIISPPGGHGSDANKELGATSVMIALTAAGSEEGYFTVSNEFRQNGLLLNPKLYSSNTISSNARASVVSTFNMTGGIGSYTPDEPVYQGIGINNNTFYGVVIDFDDTLGILRVNNTKGTPSLEQILYGENSGSQRYISNIINPDLQKYTGQILNLENDLPIQRTQSSSEAFQFVLKF